MQVSVRELKTHLSHYLQQTRAGKEIDITSHRKVIARLRGVPSSSNTGIQALLAAGATWSGGKPAGADLVISKTSLSMSELILEMRR